MADDPIEVVKRLREAINAGDSAAMRACLAEDVRWEHAEDPLAGEEVLIGPDAVVALFEKTHHIWEDFQVRHEKHARVGDHAIGDLVLSGRGRRSGALVAESRHVEVITVRDGLLRRRRAFGTREEAVRAAELDEC